jgi:hypothetical protein
VLSQEFESELLALIKTVRVTVDKWRRTHLQPLKPKPISFKLISEEKVAGMSDKLNYKALFPEVVDPDVTKQTFQVFVKDEAGNRQSVFGPKDYDRSVTEELFSVPQDSKVVATMTHTDDSGNTSSSEQEFDAKDTLAPVAPGAFKGFELQSEEEGAPADQPSA